MKGPSIELLMQSLAYLDHTPRSAGTTLYQWELPSEVIDDVKVFARKKRRSQYSSWQALLRGPEALKVFSGYPAAEKFFADVHVQKSVMFDQLRERGVFVEPLVLTTHTWTDKNGRSPCSYVLLTMRWDVEIVQQLSRFYIAVAREALGRNKS